MAFNKLRSRTGIQRAHQVVRKDTVAKQPRKSLFKTLEMDSFTKAVVLVSMLSALVVVFVVTEAVLRLSYQTSLPEVIGVKLGYRPPPLTTFRKYHQELLECKRPQTDPDVIKSCEVLQAADAADMAAVDQYRSNQVKKAGGQ